MEAAASVWGAVKAAAPVVSAVQSAAQRGVDSTAHKIVESIEILILDSAKVEQICHDKKWFKIRKDLEFTVKFAQDTLHAMIANCLSKTCDYKMYQASDDDRKDQFRNQVAETLAEKLLEHINPENAVGAEQPYLFTSKKVKVIAEMTFTPLAETVIAEAISTAAESAGFLKKKSSA